MAGLNRNSSKSVTGRKSPDIMRPLTSGLRAEQDLTYPDQLIGLRAFGPRGQVADTY